MTLRGLLKMLNGQHRSDYIVVADSFGLELNDDSVPACHEYFRKLWPSRFGGGFVEFRGGNVNRVRRLIAETLSPQSNVTEINGTRLGNEAAKKVCHDVALIEPPRVPGFVVKLGGGKNFKRPTVASTMEHLGGLNDRKFLLIKFDRKSKPKVIDGVLKRINGYGIETRECVAEDAAGITRNIACWFDTPVELLLWELECENSTAQWYWAVISFAGVSAELDGGSGLNSVHLLADIDTQPISASSGRQIDNSVPRHLRFL